MIKVEVLIRSKRVWANQLCKVVLIRVCISEIIDLMSDLILKVFKINFLK